MQLAKKLQGSSTAVVKRPQFVGSKAREMLRRQAVEIIGFIHALVADAQQSYRSVVEDPNTGRQRG